MPTLAAGSKGVTASPAAARRALLPDGPHLFRGGRSKNLHRRRKVTQGFTLLELLLVVAIVAIASVGVSLSMRDSSQSRLESEAQRLSAVLEAARAQSRASGAPVRWQATDGGYTLNGKAQAWASSGISASSLQPLVLGPEPIIAPQSVRIWLTEQAQRSLVVATDGVRPFAVQGTEP